MFPIIIQVPLKDLLTIFKFQNDFQLMIEF